MLKKITQGISDEEERNDTEHRQQYIEAPSNGASYRWSRLRDDEV